MRRRVVVTGLGAVSPVGNDVATTWRSLLEGRSGGAPITRFDASNFAVRFACEVKGFDPLLYMDRKEARRSDLYTQYAMAGAVQAMADAGLSEGGYDPNALGVILGSGIGGLNTFEEQHRTFMEQGPKRISPFFIPMFISDIAAGVVSMRFGAKGPNFGIVSACATSAHAIGEAFRAIQYGDADLMIAGGSEAAVTPMSIGGFANMGALSTRNESPESASRPFDATRDGFVMGEGAGVVILEELEHALRRGARILGEVAGYAATGDAYHLTGQPPEHEGLQRSMRRAMADASLDVSQVQYVNAHGTSTPLNDPNEAKAIRAVFGEHVTSMSVSSTKSATGHMLGAAGAIEFIVCTLALRDRLIPPTINHSQFDPECDVDITPNVPRERDIDAALSNSSGFGGTTRRWPFDDSPSDVRPHRVRRTAPDDMPQPVTFDLARVTDPQLRPVAERVRAGERLTFDDGLRLFRSPDLLGVGTMADAVNRARHGDRVTFAANQHINPTNICVLRNTCHFCGYARTPREEGAYRYSLDQVLEEAASAANGLTREFHIVGGLDVKAGLAYYTEMFRALKANFPHVHIKALTAVEIAHVARIEKKSWTEVLATLKDAGLDTLPGGGAETFSSAVRDQIAGHKLGGADYIGVHRAAHALGIRSNCTMLYGHVETMEDRVEHLTMLRDLQDETGGFLAYIPLAYHPDGNRLGEQLKRQGIATTGFDDLKMVAVGRLFLDNFAHVKSHWIMVSPALTQVSLHFGVNDIEGTVVREKIYHAVGATTPQGMTLDALLSLIRGAGKHPAERDSFYNVLRTFDDAPATSEAA